MRRARLPIAAALLVLAALAARAQPPSITPAELADRLASDDPPIVLDVRSDEEWSSGHIPGALHIPVEVVTAQPGDVPADRDVVVHCAVGPRARRAEQALIASGHERVLHLEGGFHAWSHAGLRIER